MRWWRFRNWLMKVLVLFVAIAIVYLVALGIASLLILVWGMYVNYYVR